MSRLVARLGVLVCALSLVAGASAAAHRGVGRASVVSPARVATGAVTAVGYDSLTVLTDGRRLGVANAMIAAAGAITRQDYPYVWGGGHATAGVASAGIAGGPGYNGHRRGFDCSGSVAAVLAAGGLWPAGGGVPGDLGVIDQLLAEHLIAPGPGRTATEVTLYDEPGVHIFMNINGRFFGTSDGAGGGSRKGGPGWLDDGAPDAYTRRFRQYHVLPGLLHDSTTYGHSFTLSAPAESLLAGVAVGDRVRATFRPGPAGTLTLLGLSWIGERSAAGTVSALASDGSSFTVLTAAGQTLTFGTPGGTPSGLVLGDQVTVAYTARAGALTARVVIITAVPAVLQASGTVSALATDQSSLTIAPATGAPLTFSTSGQPALLDGLAVGDAVTVSYIAVGPTLVATSVDAAPAPSVGPPPAGSGRAR